MDFERKQEPELPSSSTTICRTECQTYPPIVEVKQEVQNDGINENISIIFESEDVKHELPSLSTIIYRTECQNYSPIVKVENQIQTSYLDEKKLLDLKYQHTLKSHIDVNI
ncbi:hypothetical protein TKK_0009030 [Trichogramma kaykai]